jgi:hypothetical protein
MYVIKTLYPDITRQLSESCLSHPSDMSSLPSSLLLVVSVTCFSCLRRLLRDVCCDWASRFLISGQFLTKWSPLHLLQTLRNGHFAPVWPASLSLQLQFEHPYLLGFGWSVIASSFCGIADSNTEGRLVRVFRLVGLDHPGIRFVGGLPTFNFLTGGNTNNKRPTSASPKSQIEAHSYRLGNSGIRLCGT